MPLGQYNNVKRYIRQLVFYLEVCWHGSEYCIRHSTLLSVKLAVSADVSCKKPKLGDIDVAGDQCFIKKIMWSNCGPLF